MPTQHDWYEALREGRWRPQIDITETKDGYEASYKQGETVVTKKSPWSANQAEGDLMEELFEGTLEGKYFPEG
jgi:hypothetical protein